MSKSASEIEREIASRVRGCRLPARGFWYEMRRLIETESQRPGELLRDGVPLSVEQLAHEAGCSSKKVPLLLEKLKAAKLLDQTAGGAWYSPIWLSLAKARASQKARTARSRNRGVLRNTPKREKGALRNAHVTPHPPPSSHLSPTPPLLLSTQPPGDSVGCANGTPAAADAGCEGAKRRARGGGKAATTPEQRAAKAAFDAWWIREAFPQFHAGLEYPDYDPSDAAATWKLLRHPRVYWNLDRAKDLAMFFLRQPEIYGNVGHRLRVLGGRLGQFVTKWHDEQHGRGNGNGHGVNGGGRETAEQWARRMAAKPEGDDV